MTINFKTNLSLFFLGILGVISLLLSDFSLKIPDEVLERFSHNTLKLLTLVNPTIMLLIAVFIGGSLASKVNLKAPLIEGILRKISINHLFKEQLRFGVIFGTITGLILLTLSYLSEYFLSPSFIEESKNVSLSPFTRFLYGGVTEEIMLRWGMMTLFVWLLWKIFGNKIDRPSNTIYWIGILLAAFMFGLGHLPAVFMMVSEVSNFLIMYIIGANMVFGIFAGWLYWKKGLEAAIFAHIMNHIVFLTAAFLS